MDLAAIEAKLEQIEILLSEVVQALPARTNTSEPVNLSRDNSTLNSITLFKGFNLQNETHTCWLSLCHKADSGLSQNEIVKAYLVEANCSATWGDVQRLRKAVEYLCKSKGLARPWRENKN
jgi:hypothetical protein